MRVDAIQTAVAVASLAASGLVPQAPVAPPAPRTPAEMLRREAIDGAVERAWRGLDGHRATPEEEAAIDEIAGEFGNTYGEVVAGGARTVFDMRGLLHDAPADVAFADLGSGAGRMVAQCWLECNVQASTGVELSRTRHDCAIEGLARLLVDVHMDSSKIVDSVISAYQRELLRVLGCLSSSLAALLDAAIPAATL